MSTANSISFYNSAKDVAPSKEITVKDFVRMIRNGDYSSGVSLVRAATTEDEKKATKIKLLPVVQISGRVTTGIRKNAMNEGRLVHSGWLQLDVDGGGLNGKTLPVVGQGHTPPYKEGGMSHCPGMAIPKTIFPYVWRVKARLPERKGTLCRVLVRSKMNSCLVEFEDGQRYVTSRQYVRRANPPLKPEPSQLTFSL
jgi:hypothetical protein